jgi:hypothetical protein
MSNKPKEIENNTTFNIDRREFMVGGLALAATAMLPRVGFSAPAPRPMVTARRKLGPLEVSAIGLGCMSMNSGNYNPPKDKREMIRLIEELRELNAAASRIVVHGERLRKELLVMSGREAPFKKQRH